MNLNSTYAATAVLSFYTNYIGLSMALLHYYYNKNWNNRSEWKIQPEKLAMDIWSRPRLHLGYWFINTILGACNAIITYHITMRNQFVQKDVYTQICNILYLHVGHTIMSYFWHRAMHLPMLYKNLHKVHHHYKVPQLFDDLFFHPVEYGVYGMLLMAPLFMFELTPFEIAAYLGPLGITGL